jgi:phosphate transport system protein
MTKHLHRDLERLNQEILTLSAQVEEMIDQASRALCETENGKVTEIIEADNAVDFREVIIEEECLKMLALHQPVAIDLRRIATVLKVNIDLERIADLAVNIADRAQSLHERPDFPIPAKMSRMFRMAIQMVRDALNAFFEYNTDLARDVCQRDDEVDEVNREIIAELIELMENNPRFVAPAIHCFSAARHLERIADHATNIAEDVVYLVEGEIVRHQHSLP